MWAYRTKTMRRKIIIIMTDWLTRRVIGIHHGAATELTNKITHVLVPLSVPDPVAELVLVGVAVPRPVRLGVPLALGVPEGVWDEDGVLLGVPVPVAETLGV